MMQMDRIPEKGAGGIWCVYVPLGPYIRTSAHSYLFIELKTLNAGDGYVMDVHSV